MRLAEEVVGYLVTVNIFLIRLNLPLVVSVLNSTSYFSDSSARIQHLQILITDASFVTSSWVDPAADNNDMWILDEQSFNLWCWAVFFFLTHKIWIRKLDQSRGQRGTWYFMPRFSKYTNAWNSSSRPELFRVSISILLSSYYSFFMSELYSHACLHLLLHNFFL